MRYVVLGILAMESIVPPTNDDVFVVDGGATATANASVVYKYFLSLASLLALSFESMSSQDLRLIQLTPLICQKHRKRNFILLVPSSWTKYNRCYNNFSDSAYRKLICCLSLHSALLEKYLD